jgi:D-alanyl-D-alanine carboxypeptidase/D-alanyl-D-alanine-endopeptidase (penicillin-binding protein 4)
MLLRLVLALSLVGTAPLARGQVAGPHDPAELVARHGFRTDDLGFLLFDPASGRVLAEHRADSPFIPASTEKVGTALAALDTLGPGFRFATTLYATGPVENGVLGGDLVLRGGGDPTLDTNALRTLVADLASAGVTRIEGAFLVDDSLYPRASEIDPRQPEAATYNPAVSALSVNYNRIELRWQRETTDQHRIAATITSPAAGGQLPVIGVGADVLDGQPDPRIEFVFAAAPSPRWLLSPQLPARGRVFLPVKTEPALIAAELFTVLAARAGIALPPVRPGATPAAAREIARVESAPLTDVIEKMLDYSNNLTAELVGLATSRALTSQGLTLSASAERLTRWWQEQLPGTSFQGFVAANHSGLSAATRNTPRQLGAILRHGLVARAAILPALLEAHDPDGGAGEPAVRAKSGTMHYADGLVGLLRAPDGKERGFVILLTDARKRRELDADRDLRVAAPPPGARDWTARAKALERDLLRCWTTGEAVATARVP